MMNSRLTQNTLSMTKLKKLHGMRSSCLKPCKISKDSEGSLPIVTKLQELHNVVLYNLTRYKAVLIIQSMVQEIGFSRSNKALVKPLYIQQRKSFLQPYFVNMLVRAPYQLAALNNIADMLLGPAALLYLSHEQRLCTCIHTW